MQKILFESPNENRHLYKANLHCHSTISDGRLTPKELKELYMSHGYSAIAYTDHEIYLTHNDLTDDSFVALNGVEYGKSESKELPPKLSRTAHWCLIAKKDDIKEQPVYTNADAFWGNAKAHISEACFNTEKPSFTREYSPERFNEMVRIAKEEGFFVTYNHPQWSGEHYDVYMRYEGMDGLEIVNGGETGEGYINGDFAAWDMLSGGKRVFLLATDDNHNALAPENPRGGTFMGYVKLAAPSLTYDNLIKSLTTGDFFAGTGDFYHELYIWDRAMKWHLLLWDAAI